MCRERRRAQQSEGAASQVLAGPKWGVDAPDEKMSCSRGSWTFGRQLTAGGRKSDILARPGGSLASLLYRSALVPFLHVRCHDRGRRGTSKLIICSQTSGSSIRDQELERQMDDQV